MEPATIGLILGATGLAYTMFGPKPKQPKMDLSKMVKPQSDYISKLNVINRKPLEPFSTLEEELIFKKQQNELRNLMVYNPREKSGK